MDGKGYDSIIMTQRRFSSESLEIADPMFLLEGVFP